MPNDPSPRVDRMLLVEAFLVIVLGGLAVYFFIIPAAVPVFLPDWWVGFVLAILFFAVVLLETFRRRARGRAEMRRILDEQAARDDSRSRPRDTPA